MAELRRARDEVVDADMVELRLDSVSDPNVAGALAGRRRPVIVTCRPTWEGGRFAGSEDERRRILADAPALGGGDVDIGWRGGGGRFAGSEDERRRILADALALGAEYVDIEWRAGFDDLLAQSGGRRVVL